MFKSFTNVREASQRCKKVQEDLRKIKKVQEGSRRFKKDQEGSIISKRLKSFENPDVTCWNPLRSNEIQWKPLKYLDISWNPLKTLEFHWNPLKFLEMPRITLNNLKMLETLIYLWVKSHEIPWFTLIYFELHRFFFT